MIIAIMTELSCLAQNALKHKGTTSAISYDIKNEMTTKMKVIKFPQFCLS